MSAVRSGAATGVPRLTIIVAPSDQLELVGDLAALGPTGAVGFQVRAKEATTAELLALTTAVLAATRGAGAPVLVNDRLDVALAAGADGIHLGADDLPVARARAIADRAAPPGFLVGATCRDRDAVVAARAAGADYAGFGPVAATTSKPGLPDPLGVDAVGRAAGVLPLVAIGGIGPDLARGAVAAGAHGVAVIGSVWRQPDPIDAAEALLGAV
ncbi:thiamine phosphate synthase [Nocardioides zeae]|uniref:Thiamine-phosphate synthase n=1 Tax=Nocardioides zeae TaxID=1457234 RepID=A0AAJ1U2Y0_9ACTN|nr:thiamine phosphate synthase [Nocardioides zeae]MDQ1104508.1 thiamine-phosphate pyrophosphorylase [Nocardioides zeae]